MEKNNIEFAMRERNVSLGRLKECHFQYRYGRYKEYAGYLGGLRIPICSRKEEELFINTITKALADIWRISSPKQKRK